VDHFLYLQDAGWNDIAITCYGLFNYNLRFVVPLKDVQQSRLKENDQNLYFKIRDVPIHYILEKNRGLIFYEDILLRILKGKKPL